MLYLNTHPLDIEQAVISRFADHPVIVNFFDDTAKQIAQLTQDIDERDDEIAERDDEIIQLRTENDELQTEAEEARKELKELADLKKEVICLEDEVRYLIHVNNKLVETQARWAAFLKQRGLTHAWKAALKCRT